MTEADQARSWRWTVRMQPVAKGRPRFAVVGGHVRTHTPARTAAAEAMWRLGIAAQLPRGWRPLEGALVVIITALSKPPARTAKAQRGIARPTGKPDWDNLAKLSDALNGLVWRDDAQIVEGTVVKDYAWDGVPRLVLDVSTVPLHSALLPPARPLDRLDNALPRDTPTPCST